MAYNVTVNTRGIALANIEAGNPVRQFVVPTLYAAIALQNVALLVAGYGMQRGPKSLPIGRVWSVDRPSLRVDIQRLKK